MAVQSVCSNFEIILITFIFLISRTSTEPHNGYVYQKPSNTPKYNNNNQLVIAQPYNHNRLPPFYNNAQPKMNVRYTNLGYYQTQQQTNQVQRQGKSYFSSTPFYDNKQLSNYGNLYDSKKTSYDAPLFMAQHINSNPNIPKNYDTSEYQQILNEIRRKQSWNPLPISNIYGEKNHLDSGDFSSNENILDASLLKLIEGIILNDEIKNANTFGKPHSVYGPPVGNHRKIVGVKFDAPVKSILIKEGTFHR